MKDFLNFKTIKDCLIICVCVVSIMFFLNGICYFVDKIDSSNLEEMRYCPKCGVDLLDK